MWPRKSTAILQSAIFLGYAAGPKLAPQQPTPFTLSITTGKATVTAGSEVRIAVVLTNVSSAEVRTPPLISRPELGEDIFNVTVTKANGRPAPETAYAKWRRNTATTGSYGFASISPGGHFKDEIVVNKLFDIAVPGRYQIQVCADWRAWGRTLNHNAPPLRQYPVVCSNKLGLAVTF